MIGDAGHGPRSCVEWIVVASTGPRFVDFAPFVPSVNDAGLVAFQAALAGGGSGVFTGDGGEVTTVAAPPEVTDVKSHPDVNDAGEVTFYSVSADGAEAVVLHRGGRAAVVAHTRGSFGGIGPLGPTMNESGAVAFRATDPAGDPGVYVADTGGVRTVAAARDGWNEFHGLPVITPTGTVVFRATRDAGIDGIYAHAEGSLKTVVETGREFATLGFFPSVGSDEIVAFAATLLAGGAGVFAADLDGTVTTVQRDGAFESYRGALIADAGAVTRIATPQHGGLGLFVGPDPDGDRMIAVGDRLLGSTVTDLAANPVSINHERQIAVRVAHADGRQLIRRGDPAA